MGLCKCPKRKVTNQFCYEHRVNVCENCMVNDHPKCIVLSYLQWLQDSDYNPICELCSVGLDQKECVRLTCYHVFHWQCLDELEKQRPKTTAPAGYVCPTCNVPIFPASNLVSPVADALKEKLSSSAWGRLGLDVPAYNQDYKRAQAIGDISTTNMIDRSRSTTKEVIVGMEEPIVSYNRPPDNQVQAPRRVHFSSDYENRKPLLRMSDSDDDKYNRKRLAADSWINQVLRRSRRGRTAFSKVIIGVGVLVLFIIIVKYSDVIGTSDENSIPPPGEINIEN